MRRTDLTIINKWPSITALRIECFEPTAHYFTCPIQTIVAVGTPEAPIKLLIADPLEKVTEEIIRIADQGELLIA